MRKAGTAVYCYDANGNATSRQGGALTWTSYNLPNSIVFGSNSTTFNYNASHQRWKQDANYAGVHEVTYYIGGIMEKTTKGSGATEYRHLIPAGSGSAILTRRSDLTTSTYYTTSDHLGSGDLVLDSAANVLVHESFTPFGARRGANWQGIPTTADYTAFSNTTRRGFTGHEMLDSVSLIHMNGRVYDPAIGRFLSADPVIQTIALSQAINPFSYVMNIPLALIDPSGYSWLSSLFHAIGNWFHNAVFRLILSIVIAIALPYFGLVAQNFLGAVEVGAIAGGVAAGNLKGALVGGIAAGLAYGISSVINGISNSIDNARFVDYYGHANAYTMASTDPFGPDQVFVTADLFHPPPITPMLAAQSAGVAGAAGGAATGAGSAGSQPQQQPNNNSCPGAVPGSREPPGRQNASSITSHDHSSAPLGSRTVTAPDGTQFPAPAWADFKKAYSAGASDGRNWIAQNSDFGHWGTFDFQRNGGVFVNAYTSASNYAVGIGLNAAGYARQDAIDHAGSFARALSGNAGDPAQALWQGRGWDAAQSGSCH